VDGRGQPLAIRENKRPGAKPGAKAEVFVSGLSE
jgi:hypothetical protein